jgi:hypothetical protein
MTTAKHTPTPWGYDGDGFDSVAAQDFGTDGYTIFPLDEEGMACGHICEMSEVEGDDEAEANAAFIVKAVNNHDSLLEALKALCAAVSRVGGVQAEQLGLAQPYLDGCAAIEKAKEQ